MEPVSEVYVVLSGKDLVYVTMNRSDAEGLQYRLDGAGVDAAVGPAVLVTQDRYSELRGNGVDWFATIRAKDEYISKLTKEVDQLKGEVAGRVSVISMLQDTANERKNRIEAQESALQQSTRRVHELTELLEDSKSFAAYLNKETQRLKVQLEESEKEVNKLGELNNSLAEQVSMLTEEKFQLEQQLNARSNQIAEGFSEAVEAIVSRKEEIDRLEAAVKDLEFQLKESEEKLARCRRCLHIQSTK